MLKSLKGFWRIFRSNWGRMRTVRKRVPRGWAVPFVSSHAWILPSYVERGSNSKDPAGRKGRRIPILLSRAAAAAAAGLLRHNSISAEWVIKWKRESSNSDLSSKGLIYRLRRGIEWWQPSGRLFHPGSHCGRGASKWTSPLGLGLYWFGRTFSGPSSPSAIRCTYIQTNKITLPNRVSCLHNFVR